MIGSKPNLQPFSNDGINNWPTYVFIYSGFFQTSHVYSNALTRSISPDISPLPVGMFSTSTGLSWYHASIVPLPTSLFSTPTGLLAFIELPCFKFLLSIDPLPTGLFSTPTGLSCIMILNIWKLIGTRVC